jgi:hypothetical protein
MTVNEIHNADEYTEKILKIELNPYMWDSYTSKHTHNITHSVPRTCADEATIGTDGTPISLRPLSTEKNSLNQIGGKGKNRVAIKNEER